MCKDKTKGFNLLFLVPHIRRFTLAYLESLFTDLYMYRPIVRWCLGWERESVHSRLVFAGDETWSHQSAYDLMRIKNRWRIKKSEFHLGLMNPSITI